MRLTNFLILIFLLIAFAVGASFQGQDYSVMDEAVNNASKTIQELNLEKSTDQYTDGVLTIIEKYIHFIGVAATEALRLGIHFGYENKQYFEPTFILGLVKWLVILLLVSLLIKPVFYILIFLGMIFVWLLDKRKKKKK